MVMKDKGHVSPFSPGCAWRRGNSRTRGRLQWSDGGAGARRLPAEALSWLAKRLDLRQAEISAKIGIPQRTLTRRLQRHARLTAAESDRTVRLAQVCANAVDTLGSEEKAALWLKTPNRALGGMRPLDQVDTDPGVRELEDVLGRVAYGVYS